MRDAYPIVPMRVKRVVEQIEQGVVAEAVALLPMTFRLAAIA
jgi:hypothetical protein